MLILEIFIFKKPRCSVFNAVLDLPRYLGTYSGQYGAASERAGLEVSTWGRRRDRSSACNARSTSSICIKGLLKSLRLQGPHHISTQRPNQQHLKSEHCTAAHRT